MSINNQTALNLWNDIFGLKEYAQDCFGAWMCRIDYLDYKMIRIRTDSNDVAHNYGWVINQIRPSSTFPIEKDANFENNYEPMHHANNRKKGIKYPTFILDRKIYQVVNCSICQSHNRKGYGIIDMSTKLRIDWKGIQNSCFS